MNTRLAAVALLVALAAVPAAGQGTRADYERAARLGENARLVKRFAPGWRWLADGRGVGFKDGEEFVAVDAATGARRTAKTAAELGFDDSITPMSRRTRSRDGGDETTITFENRFDRVVRLFWIDGNGFPHSYGDIPPGEKREQHTYAGHAWLADFASDDLAGVFVADAGASLALIDEASRRAVASAGETSTAPAPVPARPYRVFVRDFDVWAARTGMDGVEFRLSTTGTLDDHYEEPVHWSPDGKRVLGFRSEPAQAHDVVLVESSPSDQVQPRVTHADYLKPGDRIERSRPKLFDVEARREIPIDEALFANPWTIDDVRWSEDGKTVTFLYNQRGHQRSASSRGRRRDRHGAPP